MITQQSATMPASDLPASDASLLTSANARRVERARMLATPTGLRRPLVVLAGWRAPSTAVTLLARRLRQLTGGPPAQVLAIGYPFASSIDDAAAKVVNAVHQHFPAPDGGLPAEVDVVAVSMGGLVARAAAAPATARRLGRRLRIARLFTLATPHRGAKLTRYFAPDRSARSMRPGSDDLRRLDEALECAEYRLTCYSRLGDTWVGARNTCPDGHDLILRPVTLGSHVTISQDPLITLDLARRLRGETPILTPGPRPDRD